MTSQNFVFAVCGIGYYRSAFDTYRNLERGFAVGAKPRRESLLREKRMSEEDLAEDHSPEERRHYDRNRLLVDVSFDGGDATGIASNKDISLGGLYMNTQTEIPVGETLALRIPPGGRHVVIKTDVVYSNPRHGVGVRFHRLSDEAREIMERELPAP